jgi:hypothetical protein
MHYLETYHVTIGNNRKSAWDLAVPILNIRLREVSILYISIRYKSVCSVYVYSELSVRTLIHNHREKEGFSCQIRVYMIPLQIACRTPFGRH